MHQHCKIRSAGAVKVKILIRMTAGHVESDKDQTVLIEKTSSSLFGCKQIFHSDLG